MNISMLPHYGISRLAGSLRKLSASIEDIAELLEASRRLTTAQRQLLQRNCLFANKHKGQPAFVIVNGPSLVQQDLMCLKNQITFCVSGFWKHEAISTWQPTYYSLLDANFFNDSERIHTSTFFLPLYRGLDAIERYKFLPIERCQFVASVGAGKSSSDLSNLVRSFAGVSAFALAQAIYMGCNPIYLLGFDHDYLANRGVDRHFYAGGTLPGHKMTNVALGDRIPYDEEMLANLRLWKNYRLLKSEQRHARFLCQNISVYRISRDGNCNRFSRSTVQSCSRTFGVHPYIISDGS